MASSVVRIYAQHKGHPERGLLSSDWETVAQLAASQTRCQKGAPPRRKRVSMPPAYSVGSAYKVTQTEKRSSHTVAPTSDACEDELLGRWTERWQLGVHPKLRSP